MYKSNQSVNSSVLTVPMYYSDCTPDCTPDTYCQLVWIYIYLYSVDLYFILTIVKKKSLILPSNFLLHLKVSSGMKVSAAFARTAASVLYSLE